MAWIYCGIGEFMPGRAASFGEFMPGACNILQ